MVAGAIAMDKKTVGYFSYSDIYAAFMIKCSYYTAVHRG
jgi:hypothetical protein